MNIKARIAIINCVIGLLCCPFSMAAPIAQSSRAESNVHWDRSQDVYFEQFSPNTYTLELLQAKNKFKPHDVIFGGLAEANWQHWQGDRLMLSPDGVYQSGSGFYFTQATIDMMGNLFPWVTSFFSLADSHIGMPDPDGNYIYVPHAFLAIGNLDQSPFYATLGINSIPFGVLTGSGGWDTPITSLYFNPIQAPQISLGFYKNGFNVNITEYSDITNHQNNFASNINYNGALNNLSYSLGAGYLSDLKSNNAGNPTTTASQKTDATMSVDMGSIVDLNASLSYSLFSLNLEYLRGYAKLLPNSDKPSAFSIAATYTPNIKGKDTPFGISYSKAYALKNVPTSLSGLDTIPLLDEGLQDNWAVSVTRPIFADNLSLGLTIERATTFLNHHTYTSTIDFIAYL